MYTMADENNECKRLFQEFLKTNFEKAYDVRDEYEILWLSYFMGRYSRLLRRAVGNLKKISTDPLLKTMVVYLENIQLNKTTKRDVTRLLWSAPNNLNTSKIKLVYTHYQESKELEKKLQPKFFY